MRKTFKNEHRGTAHRVKHIFEIKRHIQPIMVHFLKRKITIEHHTDTYEARYLAQRGKLSPLFYFGCI